MKAMQIITVFLSLFMLSSCMMANKGQMGVTGGAAGGALLGQAIGRDTESTLLGAAIGGVLGYVIGNEMDKYDRQMLNSVYESTPSGQTTTWVNPDTGYEYTVTPTRTFEASSGPCREFRLDASVGSSPDEEVYGTACLQPDGSWLIQ